jgi:predicted O-methyltransferase YrrM
MSGRVERASGVQGWMTGSELAWLEEQATGRDLVIEIGSWRGRSSVALAAAGKLVCVDTFIDQPQETGSGADILPDFMRAIGDDAGHVTAIRGDVSDADFVEALEHQYGGEADVVFVDASHDEASVRRDIRTALRLVKPGGVVCGHDYSPAWPGVMAAVNDLVPGFQRAGDSIWWAKA